MNSSTPWTLSKCRRQKSPCRGRRLPNRKNRDSRPPMKAAVLVFPGINRERDMARTLRLMSGSEPAMVWHTETALPAGTDLVVIPGGFSYGDYLRCGAIAARSPVMDAVRAHAEQGRSCARGMQRLPVRSVRPGYCPACSCAMPGCASSAATSFSRSSARIPRSAAATMPAR